MKYRQLLGRYIFNILVAIDQLVNALCFGDPDETLSSHMGKHREDCKLCYWICRGLHLLDPDHCHKSIEENEGDRDLLI